MGMSRKDFKKIAEGIKGLPVIYPCDCENMSDTTRMFAEADVITLLVDVMKTANPRFDENRFREAVR